MLARYPLAPSSHPLNMSFSVSSQPRVPIELSDAVLDKLASDRNMLGVCGLVCSQWLQRSRIYLFCTVRLWPCRVERFLALLDSPDCTFGPYVSRIEISDDERLCGDSADARLYAALTSHTLGRLTHVESIRLRKIDWTTFSLAEQSEIAVCLASHKRLKCLVFDSVVFHDLREVVRIAHCFPLLEHISASIHFSKYPEYTIPAATTLHLPSSIKTVELYTQDATQVFLSCLCRHSSLAGTNLGVRTLKLFSMTRKDLPYVTNTLRQLGPILRHLLLSFSSLTLPGIVTHCPSRVDILSVA